jgi:hypothetical protein
LRRLIRDKDKESGRIAHILEQKCVNAKEGLTRSIKKGTVSLGQKSSSEMTLSFKKIKAVSLRQPFE